MPFHLDSLRGVTLMLLSVCDGPVTEQNSLLRVGKNSCPILCRLWTKVHEILGLSRRPLVFSNVFARLSTSCLV